MSSTEPPSRNSPRNQPADTKAARDELSSKGKVEKVREIDADEQARKKRFLQFYKDDAVDDENAEAESRPSPFDLLSGKQASGADTSEEGPVGSSAGSSTGSFGDSDVDDAIVPSPNYTPPPSVNSFEGQNVDEGEEASTGALPQSEDFWEDFGMPDQPLPPTNFNEAAPNTMRSAGFEAPPQQGKGQPAQKGAPQPAIPGLAIGAKKEVPPKAAKGAVGKGPAMPTVKGEKAPHEPSPFGPPGKPVVAKSKTPPEKPTHEPVRTSKPPHPKEAESKKLPSPFEAPPKSSMPQPKARPFQKEKEEDRYAGPVERPARDERKDEDAYTGPVSGPSRAKDKNLTQKQKEEGYLSQEPGAIPFKPEDRESGGGGDKRDQNKDKKIVEIESPSLPALPTHVQPMAQTAATQAAPYLNPATMSLFFQMVGTMYVMAGPQGISRTEIVLNNPSYAGSKFFGATITIEKYASAPDSFNIRLTGSHEAVVTFKDNIPSLMSAFENGNFAFRVNRLDVEYSVEKPMFRRKERSEDKGEAGGGDLGERRK
jgi:hypothetical protein